MVTLLCGMISCLFLQLVCFSFCISSLHRVDFWVLVWFLELGLKEHRLFGLSLARLNCKSFSFEINLLESVKGSSYLCLGSAIVRQVVVDAGGMDGRLRNKATGWNFRLKS